MGIPIIIVLAAGFFLAALLYASVGFGGGSTYAALLALSGMDYRVLPVVALACNIVVVTGGTIRFARARITPWRRALALTVIAAPAAFIGGMIPIARDAFMLLLGGSLILTALTMLVPASKADGDGEGERERSLFAKVMPVIAAPLGFVAGLVGIGGGIFLAPLLHLCRWDNARAIAATASLFILVNSLFGLAGQMMKYGGDAFGAALAEALPLMIAVAIGGHIGTLLAVRFLPLTWIRWLTALLVAVVGVRLIAGL